MELMARAELCSVRTSDSEARVTKAVKRFNHDDDPPPGHRDGSTPMSPVRSATPLAGTKQRSTRFVRRHAPPVLACLRWLSASKAAVTVLSEIGCRPRDPLSYAWGRPR